MLTTLTLWTVQPIWLTGPSADGTGGILGFIVPMAIIFAIFYFFIYRPQKKRETEHQEMVNSLKKGDQIVTIGGIHGTIKQIDDDSVLAQVDSNGVKLRFDKQAIANVGRDNKN